MGNTKLIDYAINRRLILAMQGIGCGGRETAEFCGIFGITNGYHTWPKHFCNLEKLIAKVQIDLGKEIINENLDEEKKIKYDR